MSPRQDQAAPVSISPRAKGAIALASLALACCTPAAPPPPPPPPPAPPVQQAPVQLPTPAYENWLDAPQTAGDWNYVDGPQMSFATFGQPGQGARFGLECSKASRTVRLVRAGQASGQVPMRIRTETAERLLTAEPGSGSASTVVAELPASDRLLDAMAFSRGRFAVETAGLDTLYIPAWAEVTRVVEDCR